MGLVLGGDLQECGDFTWRVPDCEELVGGYLQGMMGLVLMIISFYFPNKTYSIHP